MWQQPGRVPIASIHAIIRQEIKEKNYGAIQPTPIKAVVRDMDELIEKVYGLTGPPEDKKSFRKSIIVSVDIEAVSEINNQVLGKGGRI